MDLFIFIQQLLAPFNLFAQGGFLAQVNDTFASISKLLIPLLVVFGLSGCVDPNAPPAVQEEQLARGLKIVEKVADLADRQGFAWSADLSVRGSPAVGQKLEFYLDTGIDLDVNMHGNSSAGRPFSPAPE